MKKIDSFRGEYFFLSNFYIAPVKYNGLTYQNNEAAFQAQKCVDKKDCEAFTTMSPGDSKRAGRRVSLRKDWEQVKYDIMLDIVRAKFSQNPEIKEKLIATGNTPLEEGNTWGDRIWGTVNGKGANNLGKILMKVREELAEN
ncbi:MAG: NADAR family protein [Lachnospiraceae bacterium]|nr:NADAR family protein [Lachnospiraceae bacterium]